MGNKQSTLPDGPVKNAYSAFMSEIASAMTLVNQGTDFTGVPIETLNAKKGELAKKRRFIELRVGDLKELIKRQTSLQGLLSGIGDASKKKTIDPTIYNTLLADISKTSSETISAIDITNERITNEIRRRDRDIDPQTTAVQGLPSISRTGTATYNTSTPAGRKAAFEARLRGFKARANAVLSPGSGLSGGRRRSRRDRRRKSRRSRKAARA